MAMKLFDRMTTLIKADAHGVVDALEERSLLLRQHVREAELELLQKRARVEALTEEETRLRDELTRCGTRVGALDEDIALALDGEKEDLARLARFAIRRMIPERKELAALEAQIAEVGETRAKLAERLEEQEGQFETLRQRARTHLAEASRNHDDLQGLVEPAVADEEVELELLRRRQQRAEGVA
jgi:phage shock protein A